MWINRRGGTYQEGRHELPLPKGPSAYVLTTCDGSALLRILTTEKGDYLAYHLTTMCWTEGDFK